MTRRARRGVARERNASVFHADMACSLLLENGQSRSPRMLSRLEVRLDTNTAIASSNLRFSSVSTPERVVEGV